MNQIRSNKHRRLLEIARESRQPQSEKAAAFLESFNNDPVRKLRKTRRGLRQWQWADVRYKLPARLKDWLCEQAGGHDLAGGLSALLGRLACLLFKRPDLLGEVLAISDDELNLIGQSQRGSDGEAVPALKIYSPGVALLGRTETRLKERETMSDSVWESVPTERKAWLHRIAKRHNLELRDLLAKLLALFERRPWLIEDLREINEAEVVTIEQTSMGDYRKAA